MFGANSGKKYNLTLSLSARNALNHPNYAAPSGDLSSPFFGRSLSLAGFGPFGARQRTTASATCNCASCFEIRPFTRRRSRRSGYLLRAG